MAKISIPLAFALKKVVLGWPELLWGYQNGLLTWRDLIQVAVENLKAGSNDLLEIELSRVGKDSVWKVSDLAGRLAELKPVSETVVKRKWLYLCLAWVYEIRGELPDPLSIVENIYADFDYPPEMVAFVRYMPPLDGYIPAEHSPDENHHRLISKWTEFLERCAPERT